MRTISTIVVLLALSITGCASNQMGARQAELDVQLVDADSFEIYSLYPFPDPSERDEWRRGEWDEFTPEGHIITARAFIESRDERRQLLQALRRSMRRATASLMCFTPRHAIRAEVGDRSITVEICFECGHVRSNSKQAGWTIEGGTERVEPAAFREIFAKHNLPIEQESLEHWMDRHDASFDD